MPDVGTTNQTEAQPSETPELTFDAWLEQRDESERETIKGLVEKHTSGLKSALDKERTSRETLEKQLRDAAKKLDKGSEAEKSLTEMADKLAETERENAFYVAAHAEGVSNLELAWIAVQRKDLFDNKGRVDFATLKHDFPELFKTQTTTRGNAGNGTNQSQGQPSGMNDMIRGAAGRR